jgi:APA family basic amino acid/polyamine antiporter
MTGPSDPQPRRLRRALGLVDAVAIGFGAMVGAGIFVVLGFAAQLTGPSLLIALVVAGAVAAANALTSAQLAAAFPQAGGAYEYGYRLLSPAAGFAAGWMFLVSKTAAAGTVALALGGYIDGLGIHVPPRGVAVGAITLFTCLNYFGIKRSSRVNLAIVGASLGSLLIFIVAGASTVRPEYLQPLLPQRPGPFLEAAALLFFAYTGYARVATLAEEIRDPSRTIPRAVMITVAGAILLYLVVALVALGNGGAEPLARTTTPLLTTARSLRVPGIDRVVSAGAVVAMLGVVLSQLLAMSRTALAMARRGDLPARLKEIHPVHGVPRHSVLAVGAAAALVAGAGGLHATASAASFAILLYYGIANAAALRLPRHAKPYGDTVPIIGLASCLLLSFSLQPSVIATGVVTLMCGFLLKSALPAGQASP